MQNNTVKSSRLIIIADKRMDWAARFTIASARINSQYHGEIVMIGECLHPEFDRQMEVQYHEWKTASEGLLPDSPWGAFRKPQLKPFLIRKFFKEATFFLDADIFCQASFDPLLHSVNNWACAITKDNPDILPPPYMKLWGIDSAPRQQFNSGVLVIKNKNILDQWCCVFEEAQKDPEKYDYLMNRQPWSYDQIGLIIAAARSGMPPEILENDYNFEVASKGWHGAPKASIVHFTNWKVYNFPELLCLAKNAPGEMNMAEIGSIVQQIEDHEDFQPASMMVNNTIRSRKAAGLVQSKMKKRLIVGVSQGIAEVISATPLLKALLSMDWQVDLPTGVFKDNAQEIIKGLGVRLVNASTINKEGPYTAALQSLSPVKGIERFSNQALYAATCQQAWSHNLFVHQVEANMSLAYALGYKKEIPSLYCHQEECPHLNKQFYSPDKLAIGFYVGTAESSAQAIFNGNLPSLDIIGTLLKKGKYKIILLGIDTITPDIPVFPVDCIDLRGRLTLPQMAFVISKLNALITADHTIAHIAAAMDCPQVAVVTSPWAVKDRPWSNKAHVMVASDDDHRKGSSSISQYNLPTKMSVTKRVIKYVERLLTSIPT